MEFSLQKRHVDVSIPLNIGIENRVPSYIIDCLVHQHIIKQKFQPQHPSSIQTIDHLMHRYIIKRKIPATTSH